MVDEGELGVFVKEPPNDPYLIVCGAIEEADSIIDAYLSDQYDVPVDPAPKVIATISAHLAVCSLYERPHDLDAPEGITIKRKRFMGILEKIQSGEVRLSTKTRRVEFLSSKTSDDILFSDDLLEQY